MLAIIVEKVIAHVTESREQEVTGQHGCLHMYELAFSVLRCEGTLSEIRDMWMVEEVRITVDMALLETWRA